MFRPTHKYNFEWKRSWSNGYRRRHVKYNTLYVVVCGYIFPFRKVGQISFNRLITIQCVFWHSFFDLIGYSLSKKKILLFEVRKYEAAIISSNKSDNITLASYIELTAMCQVFIHTEDQYIRKAYSCPEATMVCLSRCHLKM